MPCIATPRLQLRTDHTPAVQRNRCPIDKAARPTREEQTRPRHVLGSPYPAQWNAPLDVRLELLQRRLHHLALKWSARDRVAGDVLLAQVEREHAREGGAGPPWRRSRRMSRERGRAGRRRSRCLLCGRGRSLWMRRGGEV
ncbi:hypothetical protein MRB53_041878 [Persea americana]|nr:hypothetical protein MRB53_041878 [Persea americana]